MYIIPRLITSNSFYSTDSPWCPRLPSHCFCYIHFCHGFFYISAKITAKTNWRTSWSSMLEEMAYNRCNFSWKFMWGKNISADGRERRPLHWIFCSVCTFLSVVLCCMHAAMTRWHQMRRNLVALCEQQRFLVFKSCSMSLSFSLSVAFSCS